MNPITAAALGFIAGVGVTLAFLCVVGVLAMAAEGESELPDEEPTGDDGGYPFTK